MKSLDTTTQRLLCKEAALSSMNLGVGLTFLRRHNFADIGFIYQSFFSLSVGLERLLKLILVYEYIYVNNKFPDFKYLKSKGHNIYELFYEVKKLTVKYSGADSFMLVEKIQLCDVILKNLSDFAIENRYSHLNHLSGNLSTEDPLIRWEKEVHKPIIKWHYLLSKRDILLKDKASVLNNYSLIRHVSEDDKAITDFTTFIDEGLLVETKQKYSMYYTFILVKALCQLQASQSRTSRTNVELHDFFKTFNVELSYAKKRKSWNPYSPYKF